MRYKFFFQDDGETPESEAVVLFETDDQNIALQLKGNLKNFANRVESVKRTPQLTAGRPAQKIVVVESSNPDIKIGTEYAGHGAASIALGYGFNQVNQAFVTAKKFGNADTVTLRGVTLKRKV